ncbi:MAG: hypothetical protein M3Z37_01735 [Candidatus Eremiobacteraeota bacterium]|nr:hypothetical protein [Candidatus Eremiobacteraeota bacterium]
MTRRRLLILAAAIVGLALVVASSILVQADGYGFSPPNGWRAQRPPAGYAGLWVNPAVREAVNLNTTMTADLSDLVARQLRKSHALYPSLHLYDNLPYHVCGRHEARYLVWTSSAGGREWIHEQVMAQWQGNGYIASYVRPAGSAPNRDARLSLVSVCGVPGGSLSNPSAPAPAAQPQSQPDNNPASGTTAAPTPYVYPSLVPRYAPVIPM